MRAPRRGLWFGIGAACGGAIVALAIAAWSAMPVACPAIGYEDASPIELVLPSGLSDRIEVSACFDMNCTPVPVAADAQGTYAVDQQQPFLGEGETLPVSVTGVRVTVVDGGATVIDNRFGIATVSDESAWSRCPGPFRYDSVAVSG